MPENSDNFSGLMSQIINDRLLENDINVLLLGQIGVGKTTFINAFANSLFNCTLEQAEKDDIQVLIPASFTFTDPNTFNETLITLGEETEEEKFKDEGQSNTQQCRSFVFPIGKRNLRLIDTPGIGDTRGLEQDNKNFQEILNYIAQYEHLNAVCILLKPNEERLTILFRFCVNELLRHLHKEAKENLIFVFTNARSTFFMPGTSKKLLEKLLNDHRKERGIDIPLSKDNTFLFDNEPFRYLAIRKQGFRLDQNQTQSYTDSWDRSATEYGRLMKYIVKRPLHAVSNTLSLNEAEQLIRKLPRPIAETKKLIEENIQLAKDHKKRVLENPTVEYEGIPQLNVTVKVLEHPRTVCSDDKCCRVVEEGASMKVEYLSVCHDVCYLKGVVQETLYDEKLQDCQAMNATDGLCIACGCHWLQHRHITYEYKTNLEHINSAHTKKSGTNKALSLSEIDKRISDLREEAAQIQSVYQKLAAFLYENAMIPKNSDDIIDYLRFFIREEQMKQSAGANNTEVIDNLEKMLNEFKSDMELFKKTLEEQKKSGNVVETLEVSEIFTLVGTLYRLPIIGKSIRDQVNVIKLVEESQRIRREINVNLSKRSNELFPKKFEKEDILQSITLPILFDTQTHFSLSTIQDSNIVQLMKCASENELYRSIRQLDSECDFIVVSKTLVPEKILSNKQLLRYYLLVSSKEFIETDVTEHAKITYISSVSHFINELCNDLSQYYSDLAHRTFSKESNRMKAKSLLSKSSKCREILMDQTKETLKYYVDIPEVKYS